MIKNCLFNFVGILLVNFFIVTPIFLFVTNGSFSLSYLIGACTSAVPVAIAYTWIFDRPEKKNEKKKKWNPHSLERHE